MLKALNIKFYKNFFKDKLSVWACCISVLLLMVVYGVFFNIKPLDFFPGDQNIRIDFYDDHEDNGKSIVTETWRLGSSVKMNFMLKEGFVGPYAGIGFINKFLREYDISAYNRMKVTVSGEVARSVFVYLMLKDSLKNFKKSLSGVRHIGQYIEISPKPKVYELVIRDFKTPDWWYSKFGLSPALSEPPCWHRMYGVALATGLNPVLDKEGSVQIHSIVFYRDNTSVIVIMVLALAAIVVLMLFLFYVRTMPPKPIKSVTINYHAVTLEQKQKPEMNFLDYINDNFHDSSLTLEQVSKLFGINQRIIAETVAGKFNCNFKTYINQIRINEAKRLLKGSDLNISEIAYKVGFSSPSHFNRVFKNLTGNSPSGFLQRIE